MTTTTAPEATMTTKITYARETCARCSGSGTYPSAAWNGVCLDCEGKGLRLTADAVRAKEVYEAIVSQYRIPAGSVAPGTEVYGLVSSGKWATITGVVGQGGPTVDITCGTFTARGIAADRMLRPRLTPGQRAEALAAISDLPGVTLS